MVVGTIWTCFVDKSKSSLWNFLELIFVLSLFVSPFPRSPPQEPVKAAFQYEVEKWVWNHYYFSLFSYGARSYSSTGKTVGLIHPLYLFKQPLLDLFQWHVKWKVKGCISGSFGFSVRSCSCMRGIRFVEYLWEKHAYCFFSLNEQGFQVYGLITSFFIGKAVIKVISCGLFFFFPATALKLWILFFIFLKYEKVATLSSNKALPNSMMEGQEES